jgi:hypothetical protein
MHLLNISESLYSDRRNFETPSSFSNARLRSILWKPTRLSSDASETFSATIDAHPGFIESSSTMHWIRFPIDRAVSRIAPAPRSIDVVMQCRGAPAGTSTRTLLGQPPLPLAKSPRRPWRRASTPETQSGGRPAQVQRREWGARGGPAVVVRASVSRPALRLRELRRVNALIPTRKI